MRVRIAGLAFVTLMGAVPVAAQQPPAPARRPAPAQAQERAQAPREPRMAQRPGMSPEALLRMRQELGLTEAQVTRLEALRREGLAARRDQMAEMMDLRSQLQAGQITREQLRERVQARAEARRAAADQRPVDRAREVLTEQQRLRLAERQVDQMRRQMQGREMRQRPLLGQGRPGVAGRGPRPGAVRPEIRERIIERMRQRDLPPRMAPRRPRGEIDSAR